ncbi:hypothetical protein BDN70DRAFT_328902 [Pholiota conissans]|uniref:Heterokaryon incompatibility domain-containing protein n=1 Tax=Pholiota conissans TaxID=109636 RepID=A0A9P5ZB97_9AGAR|nr:hypothetical protein BDN70DRAFT_328902 [Pholiota conissans]
MKMSLTTTSTSDANETTAKAYRSIRSNEREIEETALTSTQALLAVLRKVITPLIQATVPNSNFTDRDVQIEHEAENLLCALQRCISCIIRDETKSKAVELTEVVKNMADVEANQCQVQAERKNSDPLPDNIKYVSDKSLDEAGKTLIFRSATGHSTMASLEAVLTDLREHVFNNLPIRLLCSRISESDGSKPEISLLEREEVYFCLKQEFYKKLVTPHKTIPDAYVVSLEDHPILASRYAVLSHTWLRSAPEMTYDDWRKGSLDLSSESYRKLDNFCIVSRAHYGLTFSWMDTICIDKSSSSELDESIRSMYKWYQNADICITYLADTSSTDNMADDHWFSRGWTLQELLAPRKFKFYGRDWKRLINSDSCDKGNLDIKKRIQMATGITPAHLKNPIFASISDKMQWAAKRQVTRSEDAAYSLMGLFRVNMSIAYGEGAHRAFSRLLQKILDTTHNNTILDIFNFGGPPVENASSDLLPATPRAYYFRSNYSFSRGPLIEPLTLTHLGLRVPVLLLSAAPTSRTWEKYTPYGDYFASFVNYTLDLTHSKDVWPTHLNILDVAAKNKNKAIERPKGSSLKCLVAVLNCSAAWDETDISIPVECLAVGYLLEDYIKVNSTTRMEKIPTKSPITFTLYKRNGPKEYENFYTVPRRKLAQHGMQFLTMYL